MTCLYIYISNVLTYAQLTWIQTYMQTHLEHTYAPTNKHTPLQACVHMHACTHARHTHTSLKYFSSIVRNLLFNDIVKSGIVLCGAFLLNWRLWFLLTPLRECRGSLKSPDIGDNTMIRQLEKWNHETAKGSKMLDVRGLTFLHYIQEQERIRCEELFQYHWNREKQRKEQSLWWKEQRL